MGSSTAKKNADAQQIRSVDRTLNLLSIVCARTNLEGGVTLASCAKEANLAPSTALRFLRSLIQRGFVERDEHGLFHPGSEILRLGANVLSNSTLIRLATPIMRDLVQKVQETVYLAVREAGGNCLYIAVEECSQPIRHVSWAGKTIPARGSAAGAVLYGSVALGAYECEDGIIEKDVTALSSPVMAGGKVIAAMSVLAPSFRVTAESRTAMGICLSAAAVELSGRLGQRSQGNAD